MHPRRPPSLHDLRANAEYALSALIIDSDRAWSNKLADLLREYWSGKPSVYRTTIHMTHRLNQENSGRDLLKQDFTYVFVDLDLEDSHGIATLEAVVANRGICNTAIAVVAAPADHDFLRLCHTIGADGFLPKTLPSKQFQEALATFLITRFWMPASLLAAHGPG